MRLKINRSWKTKTFSLQKESLSALFFHKELLEFFEVFMDMIDQVVLRAETELDIDLGDFNDKLQALMAEEHNRRKFILEGM